jgi:MSHA biogenesis protein MshP
MNAIKNPCQQFGFLLPLAIFLLVVLAALGAYAVNVSSVQQATATQDIQTTRAYHIARAGAELAAYNLMQTSPDNTTILSTCPASASTAFSLDGFAVTRSCDSFYTPYFEQDGDHEVGVYQVLSTAKFGTANTLNYVERRIEINLSKCRGIDAATPYQCG